MTIHIKSDENSVIDSSIISNQNTQKFKDKLYVDFYDFNTLAL